MGSGRLGQVLAARTRDRSSTRFHGRPRWTGPTICRLAEILRRSASLPRDSAIYVRRFGTDAAGGAYADERVLAGLHATANAPMFARRARYSGTGSSARWLMSIEDLEPPHSRGRGRMLNGTAPGSIRVPPQLTPSADIRLARATAMGHPREPVAGRQRRAAIAGRACCANTGSPC